MSDAVRPRAVESHGVQLVGYSNLDGRPAFKIAMHQDGEKWYLYLGHLWHSGWTVVDVTDPTNPNPLAFVDGPPNTWTLQVQAADGLLVFSGFRQQLAEAEVAQLVVRVLRDHVAELRDAFLKIHFTLGFRFSVFGFQRDDGPGNLCVGLLRTENRKPKT